MTARLRFTLFAILLVASAATLANTGAVVQLTGTLSVQKPDGSVRILSLKSEVRSGDVLITQRDSYARVKFADGGEVTLKPNTSLKIERFSFIEAAPREDSMRLLLVKGSIRAATGLVGQRGSPDAYQLTTASGTIGLRIPDAAARDCTGLNCGATGGTVVVTAADSELARRGSSFAVEDCISTNCTSLPRSVFVSVVHGEVVAANEAGFERFLAGESGAMDSGDRPPRFLLSDPGLQFTPPSSFIQSISGGTAVNAGRNQECVVKR